MRHAFAAALIAATLLLAACSDDGDPPSTEPTRTPSGTLDTPSPTAEPTPTEPPLPDAATKATEAGARAFITYYWDLINYAQATGDVKALRRVSGKNCRGCQGGIEVIDEIYDSGGHAVGGEYTIDILNINELSGNSSNYFAFEALTKVSNAEQTVVDSTGTSRSLQPSTNELAVGALWTDGSWRLDIMELK